LLELLNTTPIVDGVQHDALDTGSAGRSWLRAHGHSASAEQWQAVRAARSALQAVVRGERSAGTLAPLLDGVSYRPSASGDGLHWKLDAPPGRTAVVRAVLAWGELRRTKPGRLRACANPECALFLIDHSKPNKARWCSMATCGNRMKARRHYERSRTEN
jgi:predicted RNA-binding Zn ribbon-like protein